MNTFWSTCSINHNNHNSFVVLGNQSHQSQTFGNQSHQSRSITSTCFFNHNENFKLVYLSDLKYSRSKTWRCWFLNVIKLKVFNCFTKEPNEKAKFHCSNFSFQNCSFTNRIAERRNSVCHWTLWNQLTNWNTGNSKVKSRLHFSKLTVTFCSMTFVFWDIFVFLNDSLMMSLVRKDLKFESRRLQHRQTSKVDS